ncbi:MAG: TIGR04086 family membrane protein [Clostridiales bacterium]|jgi:putative membrane protein (TIGR04086 family)|nr:TIGR04086 family membrane protein [Clostridiales bacterium]
MKDGVTRRKSAVFEVLTAVITAIIVSLLSILLVAFLIKAVNISTSAIPVINQVIKGVSILIACLICLKTPRNGWLKGICAGLLYIALAFIVFSLLSGSFTWGINVLNDVALGAVSGMVSGMIASAVRK